MKISSFLILCICIFSCSGRKDDQVNPNAYTPTVTEAKGIVTPKDSLQPPKTKPEADNNPEPIPAGIPVVNMTNTNVLPAGPATVMHTGSPVICTPGKDSFKLPEIINAVDSPYAAGVPQSQLAKEADSKDQNPQNFSFYNKLQGLKDNNVNSLIQDDEGNLWLCYNNGAVTKYDGKYFSHFGINEGLTHGVSKLLKDKKGNFWFAGDGVTKYDGKNFTWYGEDQGLSEERIQSIAEDKAGNIWFGTNGEGAIKYDGKSFSHFTDRQGLADSFVTAILPDRTGNIWFATSKGVSRYDGKSFTNFFETDSFPAKPINLMQDRDGNIWIGTTSHGAIKYDGKNFSAFTTKEGLSHNDVRGIIQDKYGIMWFGTNGGGITKYDGTSFTQFTDKEGLPGISITCMLEDRSGSIWFGTSNSGLCKYAGMLFTHFTDKEGLPKNDGIYAINQDRYGNIWFGTTSGGVSKYDGKSFTTYGENEGLAKNVISILEDRAGNLWFGTTRGFVKYDGKIFTHYTDKDGMFNSFVFAIVEDKDAGLWFGTAGGGVSRFDGKNFTKYTYLQGLPEDFFRCIKIDKKGNIWFGTRMGLSKYDGKIFTNFTTADGLCHDGVNAIAEDNSGAIWVGTKAGVSRYDGKYFTNFTEKEGLPGNDIKSLLADREGNIWIGTRLGLSKLTKEKWELFAKKLQNHDITQADVFFKNYQYSDGFLGVGVTGNSLFEDRNGTIWVGANDRLTAYHPPLTKEKPDSSINTTITGIRLFSEDIPWISLLKNGTTVKDTSILLGNGVRIANFKFDGVQKWNNLPEQLSLAYNNNFLTFNFIGITMNQPSNVKYQYKLEGLDENWSRITNSTEAPYGNLPGGNYTFKVKAMNSEGYWSKEILYSFSVRPPWWKTWWAYSLYFLLVAGGIWYYIKWRERNLKKTQHILEKKVEERTAEVVAGKKLSDDLLLNILPAEVAEELKLSGAAKAKQFDEVTVMFTDFKNFTQITEKLTPVELVEEIHTCFKSFDEIISRYNIEKIKTIGDSYMCAGGLPVSNNTHASDVVNAAIDIQQYMHEHNRKRESEGRQSFEIRIGIHSGQVVAGIVGVKKFAYDIWGDTVNIASRMESSGEAGKVNISGYTYEIVKDKFKCMHRGKVDAKHKGMIDMYFVERMDG